MKSLLTALEEGRLIELPAGSKDQALEYLAVLIEAIPDIGTGEDIVSAVIAREKAASSALGKGVACPHTRTVREGDLLCAVGWSPPGIAWGAPDGADVHLVIMYIIPDSQRNTYLKEISGLAKAMQTTGGIQDTTQARDLNTVRHKLLDWVGIALDAAVPDVKARMIKLETKQTIAADAERAKLALRLVPFSLLKTGERAPVVLAQDKELVETLEKIANLADMISRDADVVVPGYRIMLRSMATFAGNRQLFECLAVKTS